MTLYQTSSLDSDVPTAGFNSAAPAQATSRSERLKRQSRLLRTAGSVSWEGVLAILLLLAVWQYTSDHSSPMFFPSLQRIAASAAQLLSSADAIVAIGVTYLRILAALLASSLIALVLGVAAASFRPFERFVVPLIELMQGIPAVCWIIFAILWFRDTEARIACVVVTTALPSFFYQARDAVR